MKYIEASGSHYEIGKTIGQIMKSSIKRSFLQYKKYFQEMTDISFEAGLRFSKKYWAATKKYTPLSWEMMRGLAQGSKIDFKFIFLLNAFEEVSSELGKKQEKCTSLVAKSAAGVFLAHNEDWYKFDAENSYVAKITYQSGISHLGPNYSGLLPVRGLNSLGFALSDDSLTSTDEKIGIPRVCLMHGVLEARSIVEAAKIINHPERAGGYHYYFAKGNRIVSIETTAEQKAAIPTIKTKAGEFAVHNNCYLNRQLNAFDPSNPKEIALERSYQKQAEIYIRTLPRLNLEEIKEVLRKHPGICTHNREWYRSETINSFIADVAKKEIWIGQGRACRMTYQKYSF